MAAQKPSGTIFSSIGEDVDGTLYASAELSTGDFVTVQASIKRGYTDEEWDDADLDRIDLVRNLRDLADHYGITITAETVDNERG